MTDDALIQIPGYRPIRSIGQGGMAQVYLAEQESLERMVALKVMSAQLADDPTFTTRFLREARIAARLAHPNIITVHEVGVTADKHYICMEYHGNGDLKSRIKAELQLVDALYIARDMLNALSFAHREGFIHRDVKPANVLFRNDGGAVLMDFGIAKARDADNKLTQTGSILGTPYYVSPEQVNGRDPDHRSDLYSMGIMLFEMLTGSVPFAGETAISIMYAHVAKPLPRLPAHLRKYQDLVDGLCAKEPDQRFQSATEVLALLDPRLPPRTGFDASSWRTNSTVSGAEAVTRAPSDRPVTGQRRAPSDRPLTDPRRKPPSDRPLTDPKPRTAQTPTPSRPFSVPRVEHPELPATDAAESAAYDAASDDDTGLTLTVDPSADADESERGATVARGDDPGATATSNAGSRRAESSGARSDVADEAADSLTPDDTQTTLASDTMISRVAYDGASLKSEPTLTEDPEDDTGTTIASDTMISRVAGEASARESAPNDDDAQRADDSRTTLASDTMISRVTGLAAPGGERDSGRPVTRKAQITTMAPDEVSADQLQIDAESGPADQATRLLKDKTVPAPDARVIKGRFKLVKSLGKGGMGSVHMAVDLLKQEAGDKEPYVAVKLLNEKIGKMANALRIMQRETKRSQELSHPNIIKVFDFDRDGQNLFMTMEVLHGQPLDSALESGALVKKSVAEKCDVIMQMSAGLAYAHENHVIHCDLKPGNVFLCEDGKVKVLDFGIARLAKGVSDSSAGDTLYGYTPRYASAEIMQMMDAHPADDVYALACVAYEILAGVHPFAGKNIVEAQQQALAPARIPGLKGHQWNAIAGGLAFEKDDRLQSAQAFLDLFRGKTNWLLYGSLAASVALAMSAAAWYLGIASWDPADTIPVEQRQAAEVSAVQGVELWEEVKAGNVRKYGKAMESLTDAMRLNPYNERALAALEEQARSVLSNVPANVIETANQRARLQSLLGIEAVPLRDELLKAQAAMGPR